MNKNRLTDCETIIMKAIWDAGQDLSIPELLEVLRVRFQKDYKRTTLVTFLLRLSDKGYVETYRKGKFSYAHALKTEEEHRKKVAAEDTDFWFQGKASGFVAALHQAGKLSQEDRKAIQEILDDMDD